MKSGKSHPWIKLVGLMAYATAFLLLVFIFGEAWCRLTPAKVKPAIPDALTMRLWRAWTNMDNEDPLLPPFTLFANKDANPERLARIAARIRLPENTVLTSHDFLRAEELKEATAYQATINNLGFRGAPRSAAKPDGTYRIIAMGSYHTFGHAVEDDDTFPAQLERFLNQQSADGANFEVWNAGRHASSVITGLARWHSEIPAYNPDMVILDFGFIDPAIIGDDTMPITSRFPDSMFTRALGAMFSVTKAKSLFFGRSMYYLHQVYRKKNLKNYIVVLNELIKQVRAQGMPIIVLRQSVERIPADYYKNLLEGLDGVTFVDGEEVFHENPPNEAQKRAFHNGENWIKEDGEPDESIPASKYPEYHINYFQYNEWGHAAVAKALMDEVLALKADDVNRRQDGRASGNQQDQADGGEQGP